MAAERVTVMVLKVDLQCPYCYKKVKKTLCKFPLSNTDKKVSPSGDEEMKILAVADGKISPGLCSGKEMGIIPQHCSSLLPMAAMVKSGEVYGLVPQLTQQISLQAPIDVAESCNGQRVKIVASKKQLQLLMKTGQELQLRGLESHKG